MSRKKKNYYSHLITYFTLIMGLQLDKRLTWRTYIELIRKRFINCFRLLWVTW